MERAKKRFQNAFADGFKLLHGKNEVSIDVEESLEPELCSLRTIVRHGFPEDARCIAYDPAQRLLAIGTGKGAVRILGDAGVDYQLLHPTGHPVLHVLFCVNEGALITACENDSVYLWNYRQKNAEIVNVIEMQKEKITTLHLPFAGKWLMLGTDKGNVYFASVSSLTLSSYVINWNKAIDINCRTHPGSVRQIATCPTELHKIAVVFEKGAVALWNLNTKEVDRLPVEPPVKCVSWHFDGRSLMTGNVDGSLCMYNSKKWSECAQRSTPHGGGPCRPVHRLEWRHAADGEQYVIFSGGMPTEDNLPVPAITVLRANKSTTVMEMEHQLTSFITLNQMSHECVPQQPFAIAVLLKSSLMVIDLLSQCCSRKLYSTQKSMLNQNETISRSFSARRKSPGLQLCCFSPQQSCSAGVSPLRQKKSSVSSHGPILLENLPRRHFLENYPTIECPHALDLHDSLVTCLSYYSDCPSDLIGALTLVGCKQRKKGLSERPWPINGGIARDCVTGHQELIVTGHKDGSVRFWQASGEHLQILYRLKSASHFERLEESEHLKDAVSLSVRNVELCLQSRLLLVTGASGQVTLFRFVKTENMNTIAVVKVPSLGSTLGPQQPTTSNSCLLNSHSNQSSEERPTKEIRRQRKVLSRDSRESNTTNHSSDTEDGSGDERGVVPFKVRGAPVRRPAGYQPELACLIPWRSAGVPDPITATALNSAFGVFAIGTASGLALVDIAQCALIYTWSSEELYGSDPTPAVQLSMGESSPCESVATARKASTPCSEVDDLSLSDADEICEDATGAAAGGEAAAPPKRPAAASRSHSVKAAPGSGGGHGGLLRRLTHKSHAIARSLSLHQHDRPPEKNGDSPASPRVSGRDSAGCNGGSGTLHATNCSPSTSVNSLERVGQQPSAASAGSPAGGEAVTSLAFIHAFSRRGVSSSFPSLWVGTTAGTCIALNLILPQDRFTNTVVVSPSGTVLRMRGVLLYTAWMDSSFCLLSPAAESYKEKEGQQSSPDRSAANKVLTKESLAPTLSSGTEAPTAEDMSQLLIAVSEWEIRVVALPSTAQLFIHKCNEVPIAKARTSHIRGQPTLLVLTAKGDVAVFSLPSLRPLHLGQLFPRSIEWDDPSCQRMSLSEHGLGVYMASQSEMEKYTVCAEMAEQVSDSLGELFVPTEVPDPKGVAGGASAGTAANALHKIQNIFSSSGSSPRPAEAGDLDTILLDKDRTATVGMRSVAKTLPGPANLTRMERTHASGVSAGQAAQMAIQNLHERGERLNQTVDATERLQNSAQSMADNTAKILKKYEKKKWYNF